MTKKGNDISSYYRRKFQDHQESPSPGVWKKISRRLSWNDFLHFRTRKVNIYYIAGLAVLSGAILYVSSVSNGGAPGTVDLFISSDSTRVAEQQEGVDTAGIPGDDVLEEPTEVQKKTRVDKDYDVEPEFIPEEENLVESVIEEPGLEDISDVPGTKEIEKMSVLPDTSSTPDSMGAEFQAAPRAFFIPSRFKGCVPLKVDFTTNNMQDIDYEWSFGDGGSSDAENPTYIYDEPGNYLVTLTIQDDNNELSSYTEEIEVYPAPEALFEFDVTGDPFEGQPVYFYNYSRGAEGYRWDFGDSTTSEMPEPTKIYDGAGDYDIKLLAISDQGCKDSMILEDAFSAGEPEIVFPNAFTPNPDGPVGGFYSERGSNNDVFHPYMPEEPLEYTLRIFNKNGNLIFESNDPLLGWDGYYLQELQPQGVYIFKVKAIFENGKTVIKMGDVTLIHEREW